MKQAFSFYYEELSTSDADTGIPRRQASLNFESDDRPTISELTTKFREFLVAANYAVDRPIY